MQRHLRRLRQGAGFLEIPLAWDDASLADAIAATAAANGVAEGAARLTLSRGPAARGVLPSAPVRPTLLITAGALPAPARRVRLVLCTRTRRNDASPLSRIKSLNYLDGIIARLDAARRGADDALLLNTRGLIAEASGANLVVLRQGTLSTPPVSDGALPGILRELLIEQFGAIEASLHPDALAGTEAAFLVNSLGVRAIVSLDAQPVPVRDDLRAAIEARLLS